MHRKPLKNHRPSLTKKIMKEAILGITRHVLTTAGGSLVTIGYLDGSEAQAISGGIVALIGVLWSIWEKSRLKG